MKQRLQFRDMEQISYALIGLIPYLLTLYVVVANDLALSPATLAVAAAALLAHLIGYAVMRRFGEQLRQISDSAARSAEAGYADALIINEQAPDELRQIANAYNALLSRSEDSMRNYQEMATRMMIYARDIEHYQQKLREEELSRQQLSRYVGQDLVERIAGSSRGLPIRNRQLHATILFADIRSFTTISEQLDPETLIGMLNSYFDAMVSMVFSHHGLLDKFVGDELMATFGVVDEENAGHDHGEQAAIEAAIAMQQRMHELMREFRAQGLPEFEIGIGINSGVVVVGNVGSSNRMDYTVIGDSVNVAARLEKMAPGGAVLVGESIRQQCNSSVPMQPGGEVQVRNRTRPVKYYRLLLNG